MKKPSLDPEDLKNFRPVSNLPYISKIIEHVVAAQLNKHMSENNLYEVFQSAYKKSHSNETALTRVQNDILRSLDEKKCVLLVLLDLSSAFDTVDHTLLLSRLSSCIGVSDMALAWFKSYLSGRYQAVQVNQSTSRKQHLRFGVPQGSVLGPLLFSIYTLPLGQLMRHHSVDFHLFADDTQLFISFKSSELAVGSNQMEKCVTDIKSWMARNFLKLNSEKTEMLLISSRYGKVDSSKFTSDISGTEIKFSSAVRNIGAIFDSCMLLESHVNQICRSSYYNIRNVGAIRKYLTPSTAAHLANALIYSKLDYLNSLINLPDRQLDKLQHIQNITARIVSCCGRTNHITPVLASLH